MPVGKREIMLSGHRAARYGPFCITQRGNGGIVMEGLIVALITSLHNADKEPADTPID